MHFTWTALEDYLLARFGISKLLLSGFELGTQAVEKLLIFPSPQGPSGADKRLLPQALPERRGPSPPSWRTGSAYGRLEVLPY